MCTYILCIKAVCMYAYTYVLKKTLVEIICLQTKTLALTHTNTSMSKHHCYWLCLEMHCLQSLMRVYKVGLEREREGLFEMYGEREGVERVCFNLFLYF